MRKLFRSIFLSAFFLPLSLFADVETLEIIAPETAVINQAIDVTVRALDENGQPVPDFTGTIFFLIEGDDDAVIPFEEGYQFSASDQGEHTFAKGFTFTTAGEIDIYVYEFESFLDKTHTLVVTESGDALPENADVMIVAPQNNTTVSSSKVTIQGSTKPTTAIDVYLNDTKVLSSQSDADGKFSEDVEGLLQGENVIYVEAFGGDNASIGVSADLNLRYVDDLPGFEGLIVREGDQVWINQQITLEATAEAGLKEVVASIGNLDIVLREDKENLGTYVGTTRASEFEGEYKIDIALENTLGARLEQSDVTRFETIHAKIENIKVETAADSRVRFTFDVNPDLDQIQYFKIEYGNESGQLDKSVVTFKKDRIREDGKYTWYIPGLENGEYFATIMGLDDNKDDTPVISPEVSFIIDLEAAPTECFIDNVGGIYVETFDTYSVIHWNKLDDADTYLVFKKNNAGVYTLVETTKETQYTVHIDMSYPNIRYEEFAIKATCKEGSLDGESYEFSDGVNVQTGPELMILFALLAASGVAFVLLRRGYIS